MNVLDADSTIGAVTSGEEESPTLDASIAMAIVDRGRSDVGRMLTVDLGRTTEEPRSFE